MSEVMRHLAGDIYEGAEVAYATDFDRVTAERDALRNEVGQVKGEYDRAVNKVDALQALLTAAYERADVLEGLLRDFYLSDSLSVRQMQRVHEVFNPASVALKPAEGGGDE